MAETEDTTSSTSELIYIILLVLFTAGVFYYLYDQSNSAYAWEDFYTKQIASYLNSAGEGSEVRLDIQKAISVARRNGLDISRPENLIRIDALNHEVCAKFSKGEETCHAYFNEVAVSSINAEAGEDSTILSFTVESTMEAQNA